MENDNLTGLLDRGIALAPGKLLDIEGFTYIDKYEAVTLFQPPAPKGLGISSLEGFVDLMEAGFEGFVPADVIIHVASHSLVNLLSKASDKFGVRQLFVQATLMKPEREFAFNQFQPQEQFNIGLLSLFQQDSALQDLLKLSGNLAANSEVKQEDDGFTQRATVKTGVVMVNERTVAPRVTVTPFRTFHEAQQPSGTYAFRVKNDERQGNMCALFDADGGFWKLQAITNIKEWIANRLKGGTLESLGDIPIIA